jgi:hypothetical protein
MVDGSYHTIFAYLRAVRRVISSVVLLTFATGIAGPVFAKSEERPSYAKSPPIIARSKKPVIARLDRAIQDKLHHRVDHPIKSGDDGGRKSDDGEKGALTVVSTGGAVGGLPNVAFTQHRDTAGATGPVHQMMGRGQVMAVEDGSRCLIVKINIKPILN